MATILGWKSEDCGMNNSPALRDGAVGLVFPTQKTRPKKKTSEPSVSSSEP